MATTPITFMLADDDLDFHMLVEDMLCVNGPFTLVGAATDGASAVDMAVAHQPSLVLLDVQMPGMNGFQAARLIKERLPGVKVVIISLLRGRQYEQMALDAGAAAYLPKAMLSVDSVLANLSA